MKRRIILHILYWIVILVFLTIFFGSKWKSNQLAFYFSCLLLPIVIGTTYFFNLYLVPKYLLKGKFKRFSLYFLYMLIISLYLEMLVALLSFVAIANSNLEVIKLEGISIFILGVALYLIVFCTGFIRLVIQFRKNTALIESLKSSKERNQKTHLAFRANRQNQMVPFEDLLYLESLNDYVKVVTRNTELNTRQKITNMSASLPDYFIRIHRSFIVNKNHIESFTNNEVLVKGKNLPISRSYKKQAIEALKN